MTGFLRSLPDLAPFDVITTIGHSGLPRRMFAFWPFEDSNSSTWSRTHCSGLGSYSPSSAMSSQDHASGRYSSADSLRAYERNRRGVGDLRHRAVGRGPGLRGP